MGGGDRTSSPDRVLRLNLSQMRSQDANSDIAVLANNNLLDDDVLKDFVENETTGLEYRYIGTGNLLAASSIFQEQNGRVTFFTDDTGNLRRGVLLPRKFNPEQWAKARPVVFESASQVKDFLSSGGIAMTPDNVMSVQLIRGELVLRTPKSKQRGGKYSLNDKILKAAGKDFVSIGARMELFVDKPGAIDSTIKTILEVSGLVANDMKDVARGLVGNQAMDKTGATNLDATNVKTKVSDATSQTRRADDKKPIREADIVQTWSRLFGVPIRVGGYRSNMGNGKVRAGIYKYLTEVVRMREGNSFDAAIASHEVGHHVDKMMDWMGS